jgi:hypothetical protein
MLGILVRYALRPGALSLEPSSTFVTVSAWRRLGPAVSRDDA